MIRNWEGRLGNRRSSCREDCHSLHIAIVNNYITTSYRVDTCLVVTQFYQNGQGTALQITSLLNFPAISNFSRRFDTRTHPIQKIPNRSKLDFTYSKYFRPAGKSRSHIPSISLRFQKAFTDLNSDIASSKLRIGRVVLRSSSLNIFRPFRPRDDQSKSEASMGILIPTAGLPQFRR